MVTGSDFLDCQGLYYITFDTVVDEGSGEPSNRPVYQSVQGDRYIYYRSGKATTLIGYPCPKSRAA